LGAILLPLGIFLASFATELWHLFLTQGLLYGIGASLVFFPSVGIIAEWFSVKRGLASGIAVSGTGVGGLVLGPLTRKLIDVVNVAWTLRIIAIHAFVFLVVAAFLLKGRIERPKRSFSLDFSLLHDRRFVALLVTSFFEYFAYVIPFFLTPEYCVYIGLGSSTGGLFVGLMSGANAVGRIVFGFVADKFGNTVTITSCTSLAGLSILLLWSFSHGYALMCIFVLAYGFFGGGFVSLLPVVTAQITGVQKLGNALGLVFATTIVSNLVGTPIATALKGTAGSGNMEYIPPILFSGFVTLAAACSLLTLHLMKKPQSP
ncbi:MFS general substrate transporter, partial [Basidiobolus meristosporus CBS 931.73]